MVRLTCLSAALCMALALANPASAISTLFYDTFSDPAGWYMWQKVPDVHYVPAVWCSTTYPADGNVMAQNGSQSVVDGYQSAFLPFSPQNGANYYLSMDVQDTDTDPTHSSLICLGFTQNENALCEGASFDASGGHNTGWMQINNNRETCAFLGIDTAGRVGWTVGGASGMHNIKIRLNTTLGTAATGTANWKLSYYVDNQLVTYNAAQHPTYQYMTGNTFAFPAGGKINAIGFGAGGASTVPVAGVVDNFKLETDATHRLNVTAAQGHDIFTPTLPLPPGQTASYRFGPSIMIDPNNSNHISMWTSAEPASGEQGTTWDCIRYRDSTNGGQTWTDTVALEPTPGQFDHYSCCDPGAIKIGNYYYLGYTSTSTNDGLNNQACVARSSSPNTGFQKWGTDGLATGFGVGSMQPFITYTADGKWGVGSPSFVIKGTGSSAKLYVYYGKSEGDQSTIRVATVSNINNHLDDWPSLLNDVGVAVYNNGSDSIDVKYIEGINKFIGVTVQGVFTDESELHFWESDDGLTFKSSAILPEGAYIQDFAHNIGLSGRPDGHINLNDSNFVAYGYSPEDYNNWGIWSMYMNPITITNNYPPIPMPEPSTFVLLGIGAVSLLAYAWGKRK